MKLISTTSLNKSTIKEIKLKEEKTYINLREKKILKKLT